MAYNELETRYLRRLLSGAHRRLVSRTTYVSLIATVVIDPDPLNPRHYNALDPRNQEAIEAALLHDENAEVVIKVTGRRESYLRRVDRAIANQEDFEELWSDLLGVEVVEVLSWEVISVRGRR